MTALPRDTNYKELFEAIAQSEETAFKNLFEVFKVKVYAVALKWTKSSFAAEEITQEVFISIWTSRAKLFAVNDPQAYLYTAIYNKVSRYLKKEANQSAIFKIIESNSRSVSNETEETIMAQDSQRFLENAIARLSPQRKIIYELNRKEGKSYNEIAEALHISRNTVKTHQAKAIKSIQNYVKENAFLIVVGLLSDFFRNF